MFASLAPLFLKLSPVGAFLKGVPTQVWYIIGGVAALIAAVLYHGHLIHKHDAALVSATITREDARLLSQANKLKAQADKLNAAAAQLERARNEKQAVRIVTLTHDILVRGPGKASCTGIAGAPAVPSGSQPPSGAGNAAVAPVPDSTGSGFIALPFDDAIRFAGQCDLNRNELISVRNQRKQLEKDWPK